MQGIRDRIADMPRRILTASVAVYVTTQGSGGYGERPTTCAKRLAEAIYGQPEVLDALQRHPASGTAGIVTVKTLRKEMKALEAAGDMFSAYQVDRRQEKTSQAGMGQKGQPGDSQNSRTTSVYLAICSSVKCIRKSTCALQCYVDCSIDSWRPRRKGKIGHREILLNSTIESRSSHQFFAILRP
ncbi:hypothetical protein B0O99DRAFT_603245 [Bisporella sp. PMI_857]|nr:hypothetical protein B0O99DRAFT_603245 [Bisporella sp. PMI_857]